MSEVSPPPENPGTPELSYPEWLNLDTAVAMAVEGLPQWAEPLKEVWRSEAEFMTSFRAGQEIITWNAKDRFHLGTVTEDAELALFVDERGREIPVIKLPYKDRSGEEKLLGYRVSDLVRLMLHPSWGSFIYWHLRHDVARQEDRAAFFDYVSQYGVPATKTFMNGKAVTCWPGFDAVEADGGYAP